MDLALEPCGSAISCRYLGAERRISVSMDRVLSFLTSLTPGQVMLGVAAVSALLMVIEERRLSLIPLLCQYVLLGLLIGPQVYQLIVLGRVGLGVAICLVLYITAEHIQRALSKLKPLFAGATDEVRYSPLAPAWRVISLGDMGPAFRLIVMALGGVVTYGLWRTFPLSFLSPGINLTSYWLISTGILLTLTSADPLRMGFGLLTCINGFEGIYLFLERSLVVIGLLGVVDIIIALSIATCAENWLDSIQEATP
jgi:hypothetical protein